jgi:hypothetical protein
MSENIPPGRYSGRVVGPIENRERIDLQIELLDESVAGRTVICELLNKPLATEENEMSTPTPEQRAEEYVGKGDSTTQVSIRRMIADAIRRDRESRDVPAMVERANERLRKAKANAEEEAKAHESQDKKRTWYSDGQAAGLGAALRILDEEARR